MTTFNVNKYKDLHPERWLYFFIALHLLCWTLIPLFVRNNLPLDAIEGTIWGHQLQWGYDKNPYLNGWLTALAVYLGGHSGWMIYLFSQLSVVACLWVVWKLAKNMLSPTYALVAVFLLEGIQYFNFHAIDFNDNTLELGLWALTIWCFYHSLTTTHRRHSGKYRVPSARYLSGTHSSIATYWILTGAFAGLAMMAKYYTASLLAGMFLFLIFDENNRQQLKTWGPYLGLCAFLAITLPHVLWLFTHQFVTVTYVFARASSIPSWTNHFFFPAQFAWQQFEAFLPALVIFSLLFIGKRPLVAQNQVRLNTFDKRFLFYIGLGPFLLTLLLSLVTGVNLRAGWGMPLLSLWTIILIALLPPRLSAIKLYSFITGIFILMCALLTGYSVSLLNSDSPSSANFPGREIATNITQRWHDAYHTPLNYVAGSRWVGGNISFYSKDHPAVFVEWNPQHAFWINQKELREKGAVFIWEISANETLPAEIQKQFPQLGKPTILEFNWQRDQHHLAPVKLGVALLAPAHPEEAAERPSRRA